MRFASHRLVLLVGLAAITLVPFVSDVWPQNEPVSGVSYIDARGKPRFKVGDWVKYRFQSRSDDGARQDYYLTVLISGEEEFWGEPCFWVETHMARPGVKGGAVDCKLMSYAMFGDTAWEQRLTVYQRKIADIDENGNIKQDLVHRSLQQRPTGRMAPVYRIQVDTLGRDTVTVPRGHFTATKVRLKNGIGETLEIGDSTRRIESWDVRTRFMSQQVPVTSIVKEVIEQWRTRKMWMAGHSEAAIESYVDRGSGTMELVAFGNGGPVQPGLTPLYARKSLAQRPAISSQAPTTVRSKGPPARRR